jgi:hypothetical protein
MGMFDTVHYRCPSCGKYREEQTKLGECCLADYSMPEDGVHRPIPETLLLELAKQQAEKPLQCWGCGRKYRIVIIPEPTAVLQTVCDHEGEELGDG